MSVFQSSFKCKKCRIDNLASHGEEPGRNTFDTALLFSFPVPQIDSGNNMLRSFVEFSGLSKIGTPLSVSEFAIFSILFQPTCFDAYPSQSSQLFLLKTGVENLFPPIQI